MQPLEETPKKNAATPQRSATGRLAWHPNVGVIDARRRETHIIGYIIIRVHTGHAHTSYCTTRSTLGHGSVEYTAAKPDLLFRLQARHYSTTTMAPAHRLAADLGPYLVVRGALTSGAL